MPIYDFTSHSRLAKQKTVYGANVVIFEGIMSFASKELLKVSNLFHYAYIINAMINDTYSDMTGSLEMHINHNE